MKKNILALVDSVQHLVDIEFEKINYQIHENDPLAQSGLRDGNEIIKEYLEANEYGIAFEHIIYMIHSANIVVPKRESKLIIQLSTKFEIAMKQ